MTSYEKNVFGVYSEERGRTTYTYGAGLISERRDGGEEYIYHYNHLGSAAAVTNRDGEVVFRIVYGTYGELYDIRNAGGVSLLTAETAEDCTAAEVAEALGLEYLYNGQYGVSTDGNGLYYMRTCYYDQDIKRFINRDILSGNIGNSQSLNRYCYVQGNPVSLTDPFGLCPTRAEIYKNRALKWLHTALDFGGFFFDGFDFANVLLYHFEGRDTEAAITLLCLILGMGNFFELPVRLTLKLGDNAGEALIKLGKKYLPDLMEKGSRFLDWAGGKVDDVWRWIEKKLGKAGVEISFGESSSDFDYYMDLANKLDVSTPRNGAVFYSGPGNRARATDFANQNGKFTLETTAGGRYLDSLNLYDKLPKEQADMIWRRMSERYAQGATGNVYGFVNGSNAGSIFNTVEYPTLLQNENITNIFTEIFD